MDNHEPTPHPDPFLDEVRELKRAAVEPFGDDIEALAAHLKNIELQAGIQIVPPPLKGAPSTSHED